MNATNLRRILVADDDRDLRFFNTTALRNLCKEMGYAAEVDSVSTGKQAVEMVRNVEYHLAVLDNNMETSNDGARAIGEIRGFNKDINLILYTSGLDADKEIAVRSVGAEVVIKNGSVELEDVARNYLEARK